MLNIFNLNLWFYQLGKKVEVKVTQLYPTLCDPMDYIVHEILQARILGWEAIPYFRGSFPPWDQTQGFCIAGDSLPAELPGKLIYLYI